MMLFLYKYMRSFSIYFSILLSFLFGFRPLPGTSKLLADGSLLEGLDGSAN
tara:strand:+ start:548 stop:700 length:153 start_codon:yes stop_codon:yes gene_type:complete